jgi:hypothetical protein
MHLLRNRDEFFKSPFILGLGIHMAKVYVYSHDRFEERNSHSVATAVGLETSVHATSTKAETVNHQARTTAASAS